MPVAYLTGLGGGVMVGVISLWLPHYPIWQEYLFYGSIATMLLGIALLLTPWVRRLFGFIPAEEMTPSVISGGYIGRDNSGTQTIFSGPVSIVQAPNLNNELPSQTPDHEELAIGERAAAQCQGDNREFPVSQCG